MVDLLLLRTSDLDVESIVNLLDFASPDDIVWFDHGKRKYYSILDDKLGDFFKDYLPDFKPKNGFLIYKGTLLYYYGNAKDIVIPNSVKKIAENAFSKNEDKVKLNCHSGFGKRNQIFCLFGTPCQNHDFWKRHPENRRMFSL